MNRMITNICSESLERTRDFYANLFHMNVEYDSDWYVQLKAVEHPFELGIIDKNHEMVPADFRQNPTGFYISFVVNDVHYIYEKAKQLNYEVLEEPKPTFYGQVRMLLKDPSGSLLDVSSLTN